MDCPMKTVNDYALVPTEAAYIGSEQPDGTMTETLADMLDSSIEPIAYRDQDGIRHYFEAQP